MVLERLQFPKIEPGREMWVQTCAYPISIPRSYHLKALKGLDGEVEAGDVDTAFNPKSA